MMNSEVQGGQWHGGQGQVLGESAGGRRQGWQPAQGHPAAPECKEAERAPTPNARPAPSRRAPSCACQGRTCMRVAAMLSADSFRMLRTLQVRTRSWQAGVSGLRDKACELGPPRRAGSPPCPPMHGPAMQPCSPQAHRMRNWVKVATMGWPRSAAGVGRSGRHAGERQRSGGARFLACGARVGQAARK